jgi:hypothetical protein
LAIVAPQVIGSHLVGKGYRVPYLIEEGMDILSPRIDGAEQFEDTAKPFFQSLPYTIVGGGQVHFGLSENSLCNYRAPAIALPQRPSTLCKDIPSI